MMRVLVLGGTGVIGSAVVRELVARGRDVFGLARSEVAAARIRQSGATPLAGDIAFPQSWTTKLPPFGAVVHAACDFNSDMGAIDRRLLDTLLPVLEAQREKPRFLYTGGCWLFGETGDQLATEETPFDPLPAFAWMVPNLRRVLAATCIDGVVIHPAMVYSETGGVFHRMYREAKAGAAVRVVESDAIRWPLVHSEDLAALYALVLEHAPSGSSYIAATIDGLAVGRIARAIARRFGSSASQTRAVSASAIVSELGEWAHGYARDQRLSGARARRELGWEPKHLDPEGEIAQIR
jgi:nucleoside-diphosphate-sugar epimerase